MTQNQEPDSEVANENPNQSSSEPETQVKSPPTRGSLFAIFLTVFIDLVGFGIVLPLLPVYAKDFITPGQSPDLTIGLLMASFSAMQFLFSPIWGGVSDKVGRRPIIILGLVGSFVCYAVFGFATIQKSITWLFIARIGAGIFGATVPTAQAYIADTTTKENRTKGMALIGAAFGLGFTLGPALAYFAAPEKGADPTGGVGYIASGLSFVALLFAIFKLPESLNKSQVEKKKRYLFDFGALSVALKLPSIGILLLTTFVVTFSFALFETTLSLLLKKDAGFQFEFKEICLTYAFIGFVLLLVQGGLVRRLAKKMSEVKLALIGAFVEVVGLSALIFAIHSGSTNYLFGALAIVTTGYGFLPPSLNALISRRSSSADQGRILGLNQSINAIARILGPVLAIKMLGLDSSYPYMIAAGLMGLAIVTISVGAKRGADYDD